MKVVTRKALAKEAVQYLMELYSPEGDLPDRKAHQGLIVLGENPNPDDVDRVTSHPDWTENRCWWCGKNVDVAFAPLADPGKGYDPCGEDELICADCLRNGLRMLEEAENNG